MCPGVYTCLALACRHFYKLDHLKAVNSLDVLFLHALRYAVVPRDVSTHPSIEHVDLNFSERK